MKPNAFRAAVAEGRIPLGHLVWEFGTRGIAKIVESAGVDFVLLDMEHSAFDGERVADLLEWFQGTRVAPIVRVPQRLYHFLARAMDAGAMGAMVANVENAEQAQRLYAERLPAYKLARIHVLTDNRLPDEIAEEIVQRVITP